MGINNRLQKIENSLKTLGIENLLVFKDENIYYSTGFYGKDSNSALLIIKDRSYLLVNFIFFEEATKKVKDPKIEIIQYENNDRFSPVIGLAKKLQIEQINFESSSISFADYNILNISAKENNIVLNGVEDIIENLRIIKDALEIKRIRKACEITDRVFDKLIDMSSSTFLDLREKELAIKMERLSLEYGSDLGSFDFIVASNESSSLPHYVPDNKPLEKGILLIDFGYKYDYYCSDITRTIFIGDTIILKKFKKIYEIVLDAQRQAIKSCKAGISCKELDGIARSVIEKAGYGSNFGHSLGHGVGLEVHEKPYLSKRDNTVLEENMVVTIEPGIYIKGSGGVRIEDMVIVKKDHCENLYRSPKKMIMIK